jgi:hypothetical protein
VPTHDTDPRRSSQLTYSNRHACTSWKNYGKADVYWGDMAMALDGPAGPTNVGRRNCRWFTMWRDPIERLASSYNLCRKKEPMAWVPLCGLNTNEEGFVTRFVDPRNTTIRHWAAHVGSYAYRQLLFRPDLFERVGLLCDREPGAQPRAPRLPRIEVGRAARKRSKSTPGGHSHECRTVRSWTEQRTALGAAADGRSTPEAIARI